MAGTKDRWSGEDLRRYVKEHLPGWRVITRKPTNHDVRLVNENSGFTIIRPSNYKMAETITDPNFHVTVSSVEKGFGFYDDATVKKSEAIKAAEYALYWIEEAIEWQTGEVRDAKVKLIKKGATMYLVIDGVKYGKP